MESHTGYRNEPVRFSPAITGEPYHSVEINVEGMKMPYQFRLWYEDISQMFFIVKENSGLLKKLKIGSTIPIKYYCNDPQKPIEQHATRIVDIVTDDNGRFKGHCMIQIAIVGETAPEIY